MILKSLSDNRKVFCRKTVLITDNYSSDSHYAIGNVTLVFSFADS